MVERLQKDFRKTSVRYKAEINDDQLSVLHLQAVDMKDTPVSQLSLCPGVPSSNTIMRVLVEMVQDEIILR